MDNLRPSKWVQVEESYLEELQRKASEADHLRDATAEIQKLRDEVEQLKECLRKDREYQAEFEVKQVQEQHAADAAQQAYKKIHIEQQQEIDTLRALLAKQAPNGVGELVEALQEAVAGMGGSYDIWAPKAKALLAKYQGAGK